jgi:hypothetical protein
LEVDILVIRLSDKAKEELKASGIKSFRIDPLNHSCAGPLFGLVQGSSKEGDVVVVLEDMSFAVEGFYAEIITCFDIEYHSGALQRGFAVYADGSRKSC